MGTIFVDNLEPQSGTSLTLGASGDTVSLTSGAKTSGFGKIGQVIHYPIKTIYEITATSLTQTFSQAITPTTTSSKIFLSFSCNAYKVTGGAGFYGFFRDSTNLQGSTQGGYTLNVLGKYIHASGNLVDSPNTTSSVTYSLYAKSSDGNAFYINPQFGSGPDGNWGGFTLMEILD